MATLQQIQQQNPQFNVVPNAQGFFNDGSSVNTPFSGGAVMNTNILTQPSVQPQMPQTTPTMTPQQFVAGLAPLQLAGGITAVDPSQGGALRTTTNQLNTLEGNRSALAQRLQAGANQLLGKSAEQLRLEAAAGIPQQNKDIAQLTEQLAATKAQFDAKAASTATNTFGVESQDTRINAINRQSAVQMGGMSAVLMAKQGNLANARAEIDRTLELEFEPIKQDIENTKMFLDLNYQDMDRVGKRQADALKVRLDREKQGVDFFQSIKKTYLDDALKNGDTAKVNAIMGAKSMADLSNLNQQGIDSDIPSEKVEALNGTLALINTIEDSKGLNTRVGPNSLNRRFLGIGDAFGAGEAFAGSVHQLTSQQTLNTLLQLKAQGGTLGALSDQERVMLQNAASKISAWERKDKSGIGKGTWDISEKEFNKELTRLKTLTQAAIQRAGGVPSPLTTDDMSEIQSMLQVPGTFNAVNYY